MKAFSKIDILTCVTVFSDKTISQKEMEMEQPAGEAEIKLLKTLRLVLSTFNNKLQTATFYFLLMLLLGFSPIQLGLW